MATSPSKSMKVIKRKKSKDFTIDEEVAICEFYVENRDIFDAELTGLSGSIKSVTLQKKNQYYQKMLAKCNAVGNNSREEKSVRNKIRDLRSSARSKLQKNLKGTGGGKGYEYSVGEEIILESEKKRGSKLLSGLSSKHEVGIRKSPRKKAVSTISAPTSDEQSASLFDDFEDVDSDLADLMKNIETQEASDAAEALVNLGAEFELGHQDELENRQRSVTLSENTPSDVTCSPVFNLRSSQVPKQSAVSSSHDSSMSVSLLMKPASVKKTKVPQNAASRHGLASFIPARTSSPSHTTPASKELTVTEQQDCDKEKANAQPQDQPTNTDSSGSLTELEKAHLTYFKSAAAKNDAQTDHFKEMDRYYRLKRKVLHKQLKLIKVKRSHYSTKQQLNKADINQHKRKAEEDSDISMLKNKKIRLETRKLQLHIAQLNPDETFSESEFLVPNKSVAPTTDVHEQEQSSGSEELPSNEDSKDSSQSYVDSSDFDTDKEDAINQERYIVKKEPSSVGSKASTSSSKTSFSTKPVACTSTEHPSTSVEVANSQRISISEELLQQIDSQLVRSGKSSYTQAEETMTDKEYAKMIIYKENWDHNPIVKAAYDYFEDLEALLTTNLNSVRKTFPILESYYAMCKKNDKHHIEVKRVVGYNTRHTEEFIEYVFRIHRRLFKGKTITKSGKKMNCALHLITALRYADLYASLHPQSRV